MLKTVWISHFKQKDISPPLLDDKNLVEINVDSFLSAEFFRFFFFAFMRILKALDKFINFKACFYST